MSQRPRLAPSRAVVVGLALLIVLGAVAVGAVLTTGAPADARPGAEPTPRADARDPKVRVSPFPVLMPSSTPFRPEPESSQPRLLAVARESVSKGVLDRIAAVKHVTGVAVADGGAVRFSAATLNLLAVDPAEFRSWSPRAVAGESEVWDALARGEYVAESETAARYRLRLGGEYETQGTSRLRVAASAPLGLPGVDGLVSKQAGRGLGLIPDVAVLVRAPRSKAAAVASRIGRLLGKGTQVVTIGVSPSTKSAVPVADPVTARTAPIDQKGTPLVGRPAGYLELYKISAGVCPGLSWTVLAAIGQVESGHGRNNGPSSAGALGPMQFMPATWKAYGVDGDGDGRSDIWSPYDAVPSAARYLCANGAGRGGTKLRSAVFRYNHSWDYVNKVLGIAGAYARVYP